MAENKGLSHAEIWDDSSLINAWDTALQEYKKYHSIQASGGTVESVVASKELQGEVEMKDVPPQQLVHTHDAEDEPTAPTTKGQQEVEAEEGEVVPETSQEIPKHQQVELEQAKLNDQSQTTNTTRRESGAAVHKLPNPPPFPPSILANENEALRNLMISWYFAGYYTGLYEGQQQSRQA